jgi:hypothetical protein
MGQMNVGDKGARHVHQVITGTTSDPEAFRQGESWEKEIQLGYGFSRIDERGHR